MAARLKLKLEGPNAAFSCSTWLLIIVGVTYEQPSQSSALRTREVRHPAADYRFDVILADAATHLLVQITMRLCAQAAELTVAYNMEVGVDIGGKGAPCSRAVQHVDLRLQLRLQSGCTPRSVCLAFTNNTTASQVALVMQPSPKGRRQLT